MSGRLQGLSTLVTGGGSGIGRAVVDAYVAEGATVTVVERDPDRAEELGAAHGGAVTVRQGDAGDPVVVAGAVEDARRRVGRLDHLACCVGVFDYYATIRELDPSALTAAAAEIWAANVTSALLAVDLAYPELTQAGGSVTLTLSGAGFHAEGGGVLYGATKWALRGVVAHLAADLAPTVRVNGVAPGGTTATRLGGLRALGQRQTADQVAARDDRIRQGNLLGVLPTPSDHAASYVHLADPIGARVITGVVINTDGGRP